MTDLNCSQDIDTYLSAHSGLPSATFGWAAHYKTYMDQYLAYRNGASATLLQQLLPVVAADLKTAAGIKGKVQSDWDQWNNLQTAMSTNYLANGPGAGGINWAINWEWNAANVKRDEIDGVLEKRQACTRPASGSLTGPATGSASGSQTATGSISATASTGSSGGATSAPSSTVNGPSTQCMSDGAPWMSPTA